MCALIFGKNKVKLTEVDSTNNYTSNLIRQSVIHEGTVVIADFQTGGKGQRGNAWNSNKGENILMSLYTKPTFIPIHQQFLITKWVSTSLVRFLQTLGVNALIKWPNDIYIENKKVAGILIENSLSSKLEHSVIGIGLNVNQSNFGDLNATSIFQETGAKQHIESILELLCTQLEQDYFVLKRNIKAFDQTYIDNLLRYNKWHTYSDKNGSFDGCISGISSIGELIIQTKQNESKAFKMKEVEFVF